MKKEALLKKAEIFKVLGSPVRIQILCGLKTEGCNVKAIQENLGLSQSIISQHLKIMKMAGLVSCRRKGTTICYRVADPHAKRIVEMILNDKI